MTDGNEKLILLHNNQKEIDQYNNAKHIMYGYKVETLAQIADFQKRYAQTEQNIEEAQELLN